MISCVLFFVDNNGVDSKTKGHLPRKKRNWSLTSRLLSKMVGKMKMRMRPLK